jgi:leucyl-tRNA synthetase
MMTFVNEATAHETISSETMKTFILLLSPFAPHICDEISERLGIDAMLLTKQWPDFDAKLAETESIEVVLQVNGKKRASLHVAKGVDEAEIKKQALENLDVQRFVDGHEITRVIVVQDRLVNVVIK